MANQQLTKRCLNKKESANYIGVSIGTFDKLVNTGVAPEPIRITPHRLVWDIKSLDSYIDDLTKLKK